MMDKELVEAVARAIEALPVDKSDTCLMDTARGLAHAALDAHAAHLESNGLVVVPREPTYGIMRAMILELREKTDIDDTAWVTEEEIKNAYRAMIDAALKADE